MKMFNKKFLGIFAGFVMMLGGTLAANAMTNAEIMTYEINSKDDIAKEDANALIKLYGSMILSDGNNDIIGQLNTNITGGNKGVLFSDGFDTDYIDINSRDNEQVEAFKKFIQNLKKISPEELKIKNEADLEKTKAKAKYLLDLRKKELKHYIEIEKDKSRLENLNIWLEDLDEKAKKIDKVTFEDVLELQKNNKHFRFGEEVKNVTEETQEHLKKLMNNK